MLAAYGKEKGEESMNQTIRIDRLEECLAANVGRPHLCMGAWDSCLIGGYHRGLAMEASAATITRAYIIVGEHFGISENDALNLFRGNSKRNPRGTRTPKSAIARLRAFIDAHKPTIAAMDFNIQDVPANQSGALSAALTLELVTD